MRPRLAGTTTASPAPSRYYGQIKVAMAGPTVMSEHIVPKRIYYTIFGVLMLGTYLTVQMALVDLGAFNTIAALVIAVFKATLVVLFFMHVKYSSRLTWAVALGGVFWLGILLVLTMGDYLTRSWLMFG
jgi:cytochrome c oxidase subunit 4